MADTTVEYEAKVDLVMRTLFDSRSMRRDPIDDEGWAKRLAGPFQTTNRMLREEAIELIESGEFDD